MRLQRGSRTATIAVLVMFGATTTTVAHAQSTDELKQRIEELERSTREQVDALKRMLQQQEAERAKERRAQEERERTLRTLQEQVEQQQLSLQKQKEDVSQALAGLSNFFDLKAGARQTNNGPPPFLGEDIPGNVDRKSTRLNSSHSQISYAVFCLKKKKTHVIVYHQVSVHAALFEEGFIDSPVAVRAHVAVFVNAAAAVHRDCHL